MRRLFVFTFGLVSFFALPGTIAMAQTGSNVSQIAFIDGSFNMDMDNCNGAESIFNFKISSTGTGGAKVLVVNTTNNVVGETRVDITKETTDITVGIRDGYVGEATVSVEADNYVVAAGEKGDQTAKNESKIAGVGRANCALDAQEASSAPLPIWVKLLGILAVIIVLVGVIWLLFREITKKPTISTPDSEESSDDEEGEDSADEDEDQDQDEDEYKNKPTS